MPTALVSLEVLRAWTRALGLDFSGELTPVRGEWAVVESGSEMFVSVRDDGFRNLVLPAAIYGMIPKHSSSE